MLSNWPNLLHLKEFTNGRGMRRGILGVCPTLAFLLRRMIRRPSASFSARKNAQCMPAITPPVFPGLRPRIWPHLVPLVTKAMPNRLLELVVLGAVCSAALLAATVGLTIAATRKAKESAPVVVVAKPTKQQSEQGGNPSIQRAKKSPISAATERQPEAIQKQAKPVPTELKPKSPKRHRRMKVHKKGAPKAVVQPRTDLMYHGMLESPQRYDPRRNHLGAGVQDPHTLELTHDHFQELDRNQDGTIDPVERTFGRLDMDRDLHDRQPR